MGRIWSQGRFIDICPELSSLAIRARGRQHVRMGNRLLDWSVTIATTVASVALVVDAAVLLSQRDHSRQLTRIAASAHGSGAATLVASSDLVAAAVLVALGVAVVHRHAWAGVVAVILALRGVSLLGDGGTTNVVVGIASAIILVSLVARSGAHLSGRTRREAG
jgi:hypothetical protein